MKTKKSTIGRKILISQMIVLLITYIIISISFNSMFSIYAIDQTKKALQVEGRRIIKIIGEIQENESDDNKLNQLNSLEALKEFRNVGRFVNAQIVIQDKQNRVKFSSIPNMTPEKLTVMLEDSKGSDRTFVVGEIPFETESKARAGNMLLFAKVEDISLLNNYANRLLIISFVIGTLFSMIVSFILQRRISKPLKLLRDEMSSFSLLEFERTEVNSNDEIGDLAQEFNDLALSIKSYDEHQKNVFQNASHELKTPLMSIQGYAEAIKDGVVEESEIDSSLDIIINESQRLKKLVDEIIYLTKLETVEDMFKFEHGDMQNTVKTAIQSVNSLAKEKKIEIIYKDSEPLNGSFDSLKLNQALINILGNGIRYANSKIFVEVNKINNKLKISIIDDGRGFVIGEEKLVFERFYKGNKGGTGIGLSITKAIVEKHNGIIYAVNNNDYGAEFIIEMPFS